MGACEFTDIIWTDADLPTAYLAACDRALNEHGRESYNGTISTTNGARRVLAGHVMTGKGAAQVAQWSSNGDLPEVPVARKWEDALAIAIASEDAFTFKTVTLRYTLDDLRKYVENVVAGYEGVWARNSALKLLEDNPSAHLWDFIAYMVPRAVPLHTVHAVDTVFTPKFTLVTRRGESKPSTRYEVVTSQGGVSVHTADTRALANAFVRKTLNSASPRFTELGVRAVKASAGMPSGVDTLTTRKVTKASIVVKVTVAAPRAKAPADARKGWLFYGVASV